MDVDSLLMLQSLGPARKFADPDAPVHARLMAAGGMLPLPPDQIVSVLFTLTLDSEAEVKDKALSSLEALPATVVDAAISGPLHPAVLAFLAEVSRDEPARLEHIALNPATSDETFCLLASLPHRRIVDIAANNQTRLLRCPDLVEALSENRITGQATIDRVLEFLGLRIEKPATEEEPLPEIPEPLAATQGPGATVFDPDDASSVPEELVEELEEPETEDERDERSRSLFSLVQDMNVMEKIKLARFGNGEARALMVRDRNKIVATAAVRSPKAKENEILAVAKSRNVSDDVLRVIAQSPEWTKNYGVKLALATNPKAPITAAIKFLNYLTDRDLRAIMRSRDVPAQISAHARRILSRKGKI